MVPVQFKPSDGMVSQPNGFVSDQRIFGSNTPPMMEGARNNKNLNLSYDDVRVAMSLDGNCIAISGLLSAKTDADHKDVPVAGVIDVIKWKGGEWQWLGDPIEEPMRHRYVSVALLGDGSRIVVGASSDVHRSDCSGFLTKNEEGHARVLDWNGSHWEMIWEFLPRKEGVITKVGHTVAMSMDGLRVVGGTSAIDYDSGGFAQVFACWNATARTFDELGANGKISPIDELKWSGNMLAVRVSLNGKRVATSPPHTASLTEGGHVKVFSQGEDGTSDDRFDDDSSPWQQLGSDIDGNFDIPDCSVDDADHQLYGESMAMNSDGSRIVVGAGTGSGHYHDIGHARIFDWTTVQLENGDSSHHYW
jgi:hypothetical protein